MEHEVTALLGAWKAGDADAGHRLAEKLYKELKQIARYHFSSERRGHTLQSTIIVHELFLRLFSREAPAVQDKAHLIATASKQMRRILIDYARKASADKRGGAHPDIRLSGVDFGASNRQLEILEIDDLLQQLLKLEPRAAQIVEMRFFGGLEESEIAEALSISVATVKRDWQFARAWFIQRMSTPKRQHHLPGVAHSE